MNPIPAINPADPQILQTRALRDALERAARAAHLADERAARLTRELQFEKHRASALEQHTAQTDHEMATLHAENKRLRALLTTLSENRKVTLSMLRPNAAAGGEQSSQGAFAA